ncbi:carbohydrate ABC transporter permease [Paenibacillus piri]|uniref:Carbohydrate ABC transporter permease n=1 Tax=Paenibacillus piri TaxID=2547395 RepID=A0A4R5KUB4_9BACL|nr:carbohydrate ABC transporter permease [Paenibacillus piri]TDF99509.1 carbohydrate ABC transporter permease [Paenibacillus piri]
MNIKESFSEKLFEAVIILILLAICTSVLYPVLLIVSSSLSDPIAVLKGQVLLLPVNPTLLVYDMVFNNPEIWGTYGNTIIYTVVGTFVNVALTALGAYPLSRRDFYGKNIFMLLFVFTMFFSGGMIPSYLLVKNLGLLNTMWALILPGAVSTWNLIIMRTFFQSTIPVELQESAFIDGASDLTVFWKIVLPLSAPILAVMTLFYGVGHWNSWFPALLYLSDRTLYPLQIILREILIQSSTQDMSGGAISDQEMIGEGIKYATMVVATLPILCLYPFLQKYFVKGVMVGAIKG